MNTYVSNRNILNEHFEHVNLSKEVEDLRKIKIVHLITALEPKEIAKEGELTKTEVSDRFIYWSCLSDLRGYLELLIPSSITDEDTKFFLPAGIVLDE